jgi:hypothetical protein
MTQVFKAGDTIPQSSIYRVNHDPMHTVPFPDQK